MVKRIACFLCDWLEWHFGFGFTIIFSIWKPLQEQLIDVSFLHADCSNTDSRPENLQVPSAIADFVHQERMKVQAGPALNRYA